MLTQTLGEVSSFQYSKLPKIGKSAVLVLENLCSTKAGLFKNSLKIITITVKQVEIP